MNYDKKLTFRAGTIPYIIEDGEVKMMFMRPSNSEYGGDAFQLAKGKVEDGESNYEAALREAKEELGLFVGNVIITEELGTFMGRTAVYVAKIKSKDMFGEPSYETQSVAWMSLDEFMDTGRALHQPIVQAAHRLILKLEENLPEPQ